MELHVHFWIFLRHFVGNVVSAFSQHLSTFSLVAFLHMWDYHMEGFKRGFLSSPGWRD
jgi:hypothetical protein